MPQVKLSTFYAGHLPGDIIEVPEDLLPLLVKDGRVLADEPQAPASGPEADGPEPSKRRRRSETP